MEEPKDAIDYTRSAVDMDDRELRATVERLRGMVAALWAMVDHQVYNAHTSAAKRIASGNGGEDFVSLYEGVRDDCRADDRTGPFKDGLLWAADRLDELIKEGTANGQTETSDPSPDPQSDRPD